VKTPESSVRKPGEAGERAHTNVEMLVPAKPPGPQAHPGGAGSSQTLAPDSPPAR
jgi:hypothetical protein